MCMHTLALTLALTLYIYIIFHISPVLSLSYLSFFSFIPAATAIPSFLYSSFSLPYYFTLSLLLFHHSHTKRKRKERTSSLPYPLFLSPSLSFVPSQTRHRPITAAAPPRRRRRAPTLSPASLARTRTRPHFAITSSPSTPLRPTPPPRLPPSPPSTSSSLTDPLPNPMTPINSAAAPLAAVDSTVAGRDPDHDHEIPAPPPDRQPARLRLNTPPTETTPSSSAESSSPTTSSQPTTSSSPRRRAASSSVVQSRAR